MFSPSSGFATYIPFKDHFNTRKKLLDQQHVLVCSQFLLAHALKKQHPQEGRSSQKPVDQEIHPTKINQPATTNQHQLTNFNQPTFTNQDQAATFNQPTFTNQNQPITTYFLNPTTPYLEWHHVGDQPKGD